MNLGDSLLYDDDDEQLEVQPAVVAAAAAAAAAAVLVVPNGEDYELVAVVNELADGAAGVVIEMPPSKKANKRKTKTTTPEAKKITAGKKLARKTIFTEAIRKAVVAEMKSKFGGVSHKKKGSRKH